MRLVTMLCVLLVAAGCGQAFGGKCKKNGDCKKGLECAAYDTFLFCVEEGTTACRKDTACAEKGWCTRKDGKCTAYYDVDCIQSNPCKLEGKCSAKEGECAAVLDEGCKSSYNCGLKGECRAVKGICVAIQETCYDAAMCKEQGQCTEKDGRCEVIKDEDCQKAKVCKTGAKCTPQGGACVVAGEEDCKRSDLCKVDNKCTFEAGACIVPPPPPALPPSLAPYGIIKVLGSKDKPEEKKK